MPTSLPAVLDGTPTFDSPLEVVRPALPDIDITTERIVRVLHSRRLSNNGDSVQRFESELSEWLGVRNVIAMSNGTLTLILALKGLGLEGKVIVPSFTFAATVHAVVWAGLEPVFADIDPLTLNISPRTIEAVLDDDVCALMPVHIFGNPCDVEGIDDLARRHSLHVVYDSAQAIGSSYHGRKLGGFGSAESFSVHATKLLPTGEGGVVATPDDSLAETLRCMRNFGLCADSDCTMIGLNAKMCEFPAVLGSLGLERLDDAIVRRAHLVERYRRTLVEIPGLRFQRHLPECRSNNQNFVMLVDEEHFGLSRDQLDEALKAENVYCRRYFHPPVHITSAYKQIARKQYHLPVTEDIAERCLCLPLYSDMSPEVVDAICSAIRSIHLHAPDVKRTLAGEPPPVMVTPTLLQTETPQATIMHISQYNVSIALPSRPKGLYDEIGKMLLDVLEDSPYHLRLVGDGERSALHSDLLLMIGDCMEFENYATLLSNIPDRKPTTALWLLDSLPPALLNERAAQIGSRIGMYNRALRLIRSHLKPVRNIIPLAVRQKMGLSACSALLSGIQEAMSEESQEELRKLDVNSQYEVFGRYEWINRNFPLSWLDHIYVNTVPKRSFLTSMGIPATFVPFGYHPNMGRHLSMERDIDVLFVGELEYGRRKTIVEYVQEELKKRGRSVTVVGSGCYGEARVEMMNRAKISLNVPRFPWDIPTIRVFLSTGCGVMVISEQMGDTAPFESGRHLVQAGVTDLPDLICHYLDHDDERQAIVQNAFDLIYGDLTLSRSVRRVLDGMSREERIAA